jgi:hypothetical protein
MRLDFGLWTLDPRAPRRKGQRPRPKAKGASKTIDASKRRGLVFLQRFPGLKLVGDAGPTHSLLISALAEPNPLNYPKYRPVNPTT